MQHHPIPRLDKIPELRNAVLDYPKALILTKMRMSGADEVDAFFLHNNIERPTKINIAGLELKWCVKHTAEGLKFLGYNVDLLLKATDFFMHTKESLDNILKSLLDQGINIRQDCALDRHAMTPKKIDPEVHLEIARGLKSDSEFARESTARSLEVFKPSLTEIHFLLIESIADKASRVMAEAVFALASIKPMSPEICSALLLKLDEPDVVLGLEKARSSLPARRFQQMQVALNELRIHANERAAFYVQSCEL